MTSINPFCDEFVEQEIKEYGLSLYNKDGIKIDPVTLLGRCNDYLNVNFRTGELEGLIFTINNKLWMSLTPMEIQSQYVPILRAEGKIALGGLGMGYYLLKVMKKETVSSIDVYEIEEKVVKFFKENFKDREGFNKVKFFVGDIREKMINKRYDFVYMDIYKDMLPDEVISDRALFLKNNKIKTYHYWGQEKVVKAALEASILNKRKVPTYLLRFFKMWLDTDLSKLRDEKIDEKFIFLGLPDLTS